MEVHVSHQEEHAEGLRPFFARFQTLNATADLEKLIDLYAPTVLVAGPAGPNVITASDLLGAISKRKQLLDDAGHRETALVGFEEIPLTPRYSLVRTEWQWVFEQASSGQTTVTLPSSFVVDRSGDAPHILVYIRHGDITAVLRQRGLLPS
jgi:hypothetical protein